MCPRPQGGIDKLQRRLPSEEFRRVLEILAEEARWGA